jgi:mannose-P-dolichol utilization defect protein 1
LTRLISVSLLQAATLPLSLLSKAPQILSNHRNKSTGNLSAFAVFNALLGCLARLFTTKQEVNDPLIFWGFAGAAVLNLVLVVQMLAFWKSDNLRRRPTEEQLYEPENGMPKRWARKLD